MNIVALLALPAALEDRDHIAGYVAQVKQGRERLAAELDRLGIRYWPSHANFLLIYVGEQHREFVAAMRQRGILVRDRSSDPGCDGCVRITIGTSRQMDEALPALERVFLELGLTKAVSA